MCWATTTFINIIPKLTPGQINTNSHTNDLLTTFLINQYNISILQKILNSMQKGKKKTIWGDKASISRLKYIRYLDTSEILELSDQKFKIAIC
jgi:hypothetical protein